MIELLNIEMVNGWLGFCGLGVGWFVFGGDGEIVVIVEMLGGRLILCSFGLVLIGIMSIVMVVVLVMVVVVSGNSGICVGC